MSTQIHPDVLNSIPEPPDESTWRFVQDLQSPMWQDHGWTRRQARANEAMLGDGIRLEVEFPDPKERLATAYDDLKVFARAGGLAVDRGYPIRIRHAAMDCENFRIKVGPEQCALSAGGTEGVRRGIFYIEDMMRRAGGPFLPLGVVERTPVVRMRISRCFFGPINRPPKNRDELADDVDYYPDHYLNRLAHDGINALWLTVKFRDLCRSEIFPQFGLDSQRRLAKLQKTVDRCARYGIRIFPFCIEPAGFGELEYLTPPSIAEGHPELLGHRSSHHTNFCTSSKLGRRYLEEATFNLFSAVPDLGGLIAIQLGERPTHCYSEMSQLFRNNCPRCSKRHPGEVFAEVWAAMAQGMHRVNPSAEMISWLYNPYTHDTPDSSTAEKFTMLRRIAAHAIPDATVQANFESGGLSEQFGRSHPIDDYSLSYIGPSGTFADCAQEIVSRDARMGAKLQVANSHEVATTAYVPVPGNLYKKYKKLHELGVSTVMQCWYFGNYPSPMTKAAGELSFAPFPASEKQFLKDLAALYWPDHADQVVRVWTCFQDAYTQFPAVLNFSWFGPVHDSVVWPLHLVPVDQPIAPSWLLGWPSSGDRVGECVGYELTMEECRELCRRMDEQWSHGLNILRQIVEQSGRGQDQLNVAEAMGMQLASAFHVLDFYMLRNELPSQSKPAQHETLERLRQLARDEIAISRRLADLAGNDSRLGFHSEAEGYKYFPEKLHWRAGQLERMLEAEFPQVEADIQAGRAVFGTYTGQTPQGPVYECKRLPDKTDGRFIAWDEIPAERFGGADDGPDSEHTLWQAVDDGENLHIRIRCSSREAIPSPADSKDSFGQGEHIRLLIESRRLGPSHVFCIDTASRTLYTGRRSGPASPWSAQVQFNKAADPSLHEWSALFHIPFACFGSEQKSRFRVNIQRVRPSQFVHAWAGYRPLHSRLLFGDDNPADYGWLKRATG